MMDPGADNAPLLKGIVELDEKYFGGKPRHEKGVHHRRGKGTTKHCILVEVERHGSVRASSHHLVPSISIWSYAYTFSLAVRNFCDKTLLFMGRTIVKLPL
jgi:hypothetical protein